MTREKINFYQVVALALILALMSDYLLYGRAMGISFFVFNFTIALSCLAIAKKYGRKLGTIQVVILGFILLFSFSFATRSSSFLSFFNFLGSLYLLALFFTLFSDKNISEYGLAKYILFPAFFSFKAFSAAQEYIATNEIIASKNGRIGSSELWAVLRGIFLAIPLVIVLGGLLYSSDLVVQAYLSKFVVVKINYEIIFRSLFVFLVFIFLIGIFSRIISGKKPELTVSTGVGGRTLGFVESITVLTLVEILFFAFIAFQFYYLFGGKDYVWGINETITYATYAKKGFYELLLVSLISFLLLYAIDRFGKRESSKEAGRFKIYEAVLILEIFIIIASAFMRVSLYTDGYGLTFSRFLAFAILIWISGVFLIFLAKVWLEKKREFLYFGVFMLSITTWLGINIANPDALIARVNIERLAQNKNVDSFYFSNLSEDAVPEIVKIFNTNADKEVKEQAAVGLYTRYYPSYNYMCRGFDAMPQECVYVPFREVVSGIKNASDWRSLNYSRIKASLALEKNMDEIMRYQAAYWRREENNCRQATSDCEKRCDIAAEKGESVAAFCKQNCGAELCDSYPGL